MPNCRRTFRVAAVTAIATDTGFLNLVAKPGIDVSHRSVCLVYS